MAISIEAREDLVTLVVGMFDAAPGAAVLTDLTVAYEAGIAGGASSADVMANIATSLASSDFYKSIYPEFLTNAEFTTKLVNNLAGDTLDGTAKADASALLLAQLNGMDTSTAASKAAARAAVTMTAIAAIESAAADDATFGDLKTQFTNKVEVATFYSVDQQQNITGLADAQDVIKDVTQDESSVTDAKNAITGEATAGTEFTLTGGVDDVTGTNGNDTINAFSVQGSSSTATTTFSSFDEIDGGDGEDTFNLYTNSTSGKNTAFPSSGSVNNVEIVNIYNEVNASTAFTDASKYTGVTQLWQIGADADDVSNLAATTTAGFKSVEADTAADIDVAATATAASATIALDGVKGNATTNDAEIGVSGSALADVTVTGTLAQRTVNTTAASLDLDVTAGKDVETLSVNSAVKTTLTVTEGAGSTKEIKTVDASGSTGAITYAGAVTGATVAPATIKTGSGNDTATIAVATLKDDASTTAVDETRSALLETAAGNDTITVNTSGTGTTTVNAGEGNDKVTLNADGSGKLTVNLGAGNDSFDVTGTGVVTGSDVIDGGEGTDTLLLKLVGAANIAAFSNFETFDTAALGKTLDVDILASKNTVTEFVASADVAASSVLTNVGAGVNFRATGDMTTNALTLTQKTAGALTVTLDADSASTTSQNDKNLKAVATNATSLKAVFDADSGYVQNGTNLNDQNITLTGTKASSLEVVSGGSEATNTLNYTSGAGTGTNDILTSITISGEQDLSVTVTETNANSAVTAIDASALTGDLTISTAELKAEASPNAFDGGILTLGTGDDVVTITQGAKVSGIEKGSAEGLTSQTDFDVLTTGSAAAQAADVASTGTLNIKDGLLTFEGTGPATLAAAITTVDGQVSTTGDAVVFEYIGNSYVFVQGGGTDVVVQLAGVTGLSGLGEVGTTDNLYVF
ncbi:hypothetical protein [Pseudohongiella nitratireducens]|uniref:beta strand repeat-containing protein n=1 Tax=Pseudohongiella nitratireducens TaxID=1768907 RepID=UPI0030EC9C98|tara:strand:- start:4859 stop:7630 length:2772 start_codon:yes stop_codon:yes gene_type:complete